MNTALHTLRIGSHTVEAALIAFDKDGLLFDSEVFLLELNRMRIIAMLRQGACREFVSEWMLQLGVRFRFTQAGEPEMLGLRPDSPAIIASVSEEVLVSAAFFAEHLRLPWSDARTLAEYVHAWADRHLDDACAIRPHRGFPEIFRRLDAGGVPYGIVTLDSRERAVRVISRYCHAENLSFILSPSEVPRVKPEPDALLALAERFSVPANRIVMVGDMYVDLQMARRAGAFSVGIPESESTRSRMEPFADVICRSLDEITVADGAACGGHP